MNLRNWIHRQFRKKSRVYIFPTRMGGYFIGLIFLMFLMALGYSNNLLLIFTVFLLGFNILWLIQSHFHLYRLKFDQLEITPGHAGERLAVKIFWKMTPPSPLDWEIVLESNQGKFQFNHDKYIALKNEGHFIPNKRGQYQWQFLKVKTINPFGLYATWIYYPLKQTTYVYPALMNHVELFLTGRKQEGEFQQDNKGYDDFRGLVSYAGDESRRISWKHFARSGELFIKEGEETNAPVFQIELKIPHETLKESYLSYVATQLVECNRRSIPFNFKRPGMQSSSLPDCLKALSSC